MNSREYNLRSFNMCVENLPTAFKFKPLNNQAMIMINITENGLLEFDIEKGSNIHNVNLNYLNENIETEDKIFKVKISAKKNSCLKIFVSILNLKSELFINKNINFLKNQQNPSEKLINIITIDKGNTISYNSFRDIDNQFINNKILLPNQIGNNGLSNQNQIGNNRLSNQNKNQNLNGLSASILNNLQSQRQNQASNQSYNKLSNKRQNPIPNPIPKPNPIPNPKSNNQVPIISNIKYKEILVITVNFGSYDSVPSDLNLIENYNYFDWVYINDNPNINPNGWSIKSNSDYHLDNIEIIHNNDVNRMYSKFYKTQLLNMEKYFDYKYIIWIDASIMITNKNFVNDILTLLKNNESEDFFIFEHCERDSIQLELLASMTLSKYSNQDMCSQVKSYYNSGYKSGIYESGFFIYKVNYKTIIMMDDWWDEIQKYSYQCQLSLPYVLYKNDIKPFVLNEPEFKKGVVCGEGSVWKNKLVGYVRNHQ
jgi:hypothetical protein